MGGSAFEVEQDVLLFCESKHALAGVRGATLRRRQHASFLAESWPTALSCSRSVRLGYKNARSVTSGPVGISAPPGPALDLYVVAGRGKYKLPMSSKNWGEGSRPEKTDFTVFPDAPFFNHSFR